MSTPIQELKCIDCQEPLTESTRQARGGWLRSVGGDEFIDEIHLCSQCGAWSMVTFIDRFAGPDEIKVTGPLTSDEARQQRQRLSGQ